jgi:hypothetical protein
MWLGIGVKIVNWWRSLAANGPFSNHATLTSNLVSYWKLDETSGVRYDSVTTSANDLTDNNTVDVSPAGPSGTVAEFLSTNSERLSHATLANVLDWSLGVTASFWVYLSPSGGAPGYIGFGANIYQGASGFMINNQGSSHNLLFLVLEANGSYDPKLAGSPILTENTWHHFVMTYDPADRKGRLWVDTVLTLTTAAVAAHPDPGFSTNKTFRLGADGNNGSHFTGNQGRAGVWNRTFGSPDVTSLYNSGVGKSYSALTTAEKVSLVSYWNLDEVSGTRADSHGSNTLTDNNTVTSVNSGPVGTVAQFTAANSEYLSSVDDNSGLSVDGDHTFTAWVYLPASGSNQSILSQRTSGDGAYQFYFDTGDKLHAYVTDSVAGFSEPVTAVASAIGWHFCVMTYTASDKKLRVYVDEGAAAAGAALANGPVASAQDFNIGRLASSIYTNAKIARVGTWTSVLGASTITSLFNSGNGKSYSDLTAAEKVGLVSYWNLNETSGNRADSHGSNTLTDNNTVTSVVNAGGAMRNAAASFVAANSESLSRTNFSPLTETITRSLSFWFQGPATGYTGLLTVGATPAEASPTYQLNFENNKLRIVHMGALVTGTTTITDGTWYFGVLIYDHSLAQLRVYINDVLELSENTAETTAYTDTNFYLGSSATGYWGRTIDEVGVWSRVLTAQERTDLYNAGAGLFY